MQLNLPYNVDLRPFLPEGWAEDLERFMRANARDVTQDEGGPGSLGYREAAGVDYSYAQAEALTNALPWIKYLHTELIPVLLNLRGYGGLVGDPRADGTVIPIEGEHGVTANLYRGSRKGIEWHRDGADVWLNVLITTSRFDRTTGGRLLVHDGARVRGTNFPAPGIGVVALVGDFPHIGEQVKDPEAERVVLMFSYTNAERQGWREEHYDEHFYPTKTESTEAAS